jgi:hypothetical protein
MKRRKILATGSALAWPLAALAQQAKKLPRVGILTAAASDRTAIFEAFRNGLGDLATSTARRSPSTIASPRENTNTA